ncbi:MAG: aldo/keto reductase [Candidatus Limivicinus sp.]|jgi:predicted aldo/keto reductase-like oxidoreductase
MKKIRLGKTELSVTSPAMGCLPVQRCDEAYAVKLLRAAFEGGINYFDTANAYTDSEKKIGLALSDVRDRIVLSTKSAGSDRKTVLAHIENSLRVMKTDYIDLFQFHQMAALPDFDDPEGPYAGALEAKKRGWIGHIGLTTHRIDVAEASIDCGMFETLQFPFSYISSERDLALAEKCRKADMGYIAMKGLAGGLLGTSPRACYAFMNCYDNVVPIWGIQKLEELNEWLELAEEDPHMDESLAEIIRADRQQLSGSFCRSCGYCMPCTVGIDIRNCARMDMLLRRSPWQQYMTDEWREKMNKINDCVGCGKCSSRCPYQLDTPNLLKYMLKDYNEFYETHKNLL